MAPLVGPHDEKYEEFYSNWFKEQEKLLAGLMEAVQGDMKEPELLHEVTKVADHYEAYYRAKKSASCQDILQIVTSAWRSPFERAFLWLGGWRPCLAFQLVYALAGQQIEAELAELLEGVDTQSFASLSSWQLCQISDLQSYTNSQEDNLNNEMAILQQSFAEQPLLTLAQAHHMVQAESDRSGTDGSSHDDDNEGDASRHGDVHTGDGSSHDDGEGQASEHGDAGSVGGNQDEGHADPGSGSLDQAQEEQQQQPHNDDDEGMGGAIQEKLTSLQSIAIQADFLRLTTLRKILDVLDTFQKAQYLISAGRLQTALHAVGQKLDRQSYDP